jgi:predicted nucleic acid-binding protein
VTTFVDTSGLLAVVDADDAFHARAARIWSALLAASDPLVTTSYVLVETFALVQARLGIAAAQSLHDDIVPVLNVIWVDQTLHGIAAATMLAAKRRHLSLVDCVSFEAMRRHGVTQVFGFDRHFLQQGFRLSS